jgi:hypothetical protein
LNDLEGGPGLVQNKTPYLSISVGDRTKETELADWSKEKGQWCFRETITVIVETTDELSLVASCSKKYDLYVAAVSLDSQRLGENCFPVAGILPRLRAEDRDEDGLVYTTPTIPFDVMQNGRVAGRVYLSFETLTPPPSLKPISDLHPCCGAFDGGKFRDEDGEDASTAASSERRSSHCVTGSLDDPTLLYRVANVMTDR